MTDLTATLRTYNRDACAHTHDHHQIVIAVRGQLDMQVGAHLAAARKLQTAMICAGEAHSFQASGVNRFIVVDLACDSSSARLIGRRLWDHAARQPFQTIDACLADDLDELAVAEDESRAQRLARDIYAHLLERIGRSDQLVRRMRAALDYAHAHYTKRLGVADLAHRANLEASQFHKLFRLYTGRSPHRYLQVLRARHALQALRNTRLNLAEVAADAGYPDQSALTRAIKRHYGTTPGAVRQQQTA